MDYMQQLGSLSLASRLKRLSDQLMTEVATIYAEKGITLNPSYFPLLTLISKHGPQGITEAAHKLSVSHPAISKLANKMIADGYLIKTKNVQDKRTAKLALTDNSEALIKQAEPIWGALKKQIERLDKQHNVSLLHAIEQFETGLKEINLSQQVLGELNQGNVQIDIVNWDIKYKASFKALNLQWLNEYFAYEITATDLQALNNPEQYYLARGGYIYFAKHNDKVIGTLALLGTDKDRFEISKMTVTTDYHGQGIGRRLLLTALEKARQLNARCVFLESNTALTRAINLYQHCGFHQAPHPNGESEYARSDIYMELQFSGQQ